MFTVEMLPARQGDALWIQWGSEESSHVILIDGGVPRTVDFIRRRIAALSKPHIDLMIVTHIDNDHIGGIVELLRNPPEDLTFGDIWFNGWEQIAQDDVLGALQGEELGALLRKHRLPHNMGFHGGPVVRYPNQEFPIHTLEGLRVTLLGPTPDRLLRLRDEWETEILGKGLVPGEAGDDPDDVLGDSDFMEESLQIQHGRDTSPANGSSIAVLLEFERKSLLCLGDAFPEDMTTAIQDLASRNGEDQLSVTATKLSHHGGKSNTSVGLVQVLDCSKWLISTDGSGSANHPHATALARVVRHAKGPSQQTLVFNYLSEESAPWREETLQDSEDFRSLQPQEGTSGFLVEII